MSLLTYLTLLSTLHSGQSATASSVAVEQAFRGYGLVPQLLPAAPPCFVVVTYASRLQVVLGTLLAPEQLREEPLRVRLPACPGRYYTLLLLDPDSPPSAPAGNSTRVARLWHVANIPGDDVPAGETLVAYRGPQPGAGPHRYPFLVYRQERKLVFDEPRVLATGDAGREFSLRGFVARYGLTLAGGNLLQAAGGDVRCLQGLTPRSAPGAARL